MAPCPCGSGSDYDDCCGPIIGGAPAPTAEALMRSRFTAFVRGNVDHIEKTHSTAVHDFDRAEADATATSVEWTRLEILDTVGGGEGDETGVVEFAAHFRHEGVQQVHHERSSFCRENGRWVYADGLINPKGQPRRTQKVGRNDPCPCGSGKKFKKCCGA